MYDPKWIRENAEAFDRGLKRRGLPPESAGIIALDEKRRDIITRLQALLERRNAASKDIGAAKKSKDEATANALMAEVGKIKEDMPALEAERAAVEKELNDKLAQMPNLPADDVPEGTDEKSNVERKDHAFGAKPSIASPKQHFELGEALGLMDFEAAAKLSGSRFVVLKGALARLERAISQLFLDVHTEEFGYTEVAPPLLVRDEVMFGTAQLPKFEVDQFFVDRVSRLDAESYAEALGDFSTDAQLEKAARASGDEKVINAFELYLSCKNHEPKDENDAPSPAFYERLYFVEFVKAFLAHQRKIPPRLGLIPTAEVPLTNLVRESIQDEDALPLRYTACTPCFRAEAGAAGKDTRGMLRQHQFTKVELVSITTPEQSKDEHERMLGAAEEVLKRLNLPFRVMTLCTGDMGFASQKTYDIEVWLPGQNAYREISSCSNCGEFQARRMEARWRRKDGKVAGPVHTLNGSGVAVGRALIAIMENYQDEHGAITIPEVLQPYMGGLKKIEKKN
jgi:seryl-tRNA synthetase